MHPKFKSTSFLPTGSSDLTAPAAEIAITMSVMRITVAQKLTYHVGEKIKSVHTWFSIFFVKYFENEIPAKWGSSQTFSPSRLTILS